jgi:hypothetical protein
MSMAKHGNSKVNSLRSDSMTETNVAAEVSLRTNQNTMKKITPHLLFDKEAR